MSFEVEGIVESFSTDRTQVSLDVAVTLDVTTKQSPDGKLLPTDATHDLVIRSLDPEVLRVHEEIATLIQKRVLYPVTSVYRFRFCQRRSLQRTNTTNDIMHNMHMCDVLLQIYLALV